MKINRKKLEEMCRHISSRELLAKKAQRDSIKYKQVEYLMEKKGSVFEAVVSGVTDWGLYVEIIENKCEGMIRYSTLEGKWKIDKENYQISNGLVNIRLGDVLIVKVASVDLEKKQIDFNIFN